LGGTYDEDPQTRVRQLRVRRGIRLGQFLKVAGLLDSGGSVKGGHPGLPLIAFLAAQLRRESLFRLARTDR